MKNVTDKLTGKMLLVVNCAGNRYYGGGGCFVKDFQSKKKGQTNPKMLGCFFNVVYSQCFSSERHVLKLQKALQKP